MVGNLYIHIGKTLKSRRNSLGLTQADLCERVSRITPLTRASIANIEKGKQRPPLHLLYILSNQLNFESIHELLPLSLDDVSGVMSSTKKAQIEEGVTKPLAEDRLAALLED